MWALNAFVLVAVLQLLGATAGTLEAYPSNHLETSSGASCEFAQLAGAVDADGLRTQIDELATFSDTPAPSVTRILYTENDISARTYIKDSMKSAGLTVREDAIGNIFGRWQGTEETSVVGTGSHVDAIPYAGKYDGVVGVLGAIEAIRALRKVGFTPRRSLEVIMFTSEEPTRFGFGCLGSRAMAGSRNIYEILEGAMDKDNISFTEAARTAGYLKEGEDLKSVAVTNETYSGFVELHIEQGPTLENEGIAIGIITAIAAPASLKVDFKGDGGHAGAVLMPFRNDAGLAAAELAVAVEQHVLASGSIDTVGTTGVMQIHPGAVNSIPREAHLEIDVRDIDEDRRDMVVEKIHQSAKDISNRRNVELQSFDVVNQDPPAQSGATIVEAATSASDELGFKSKHMISRAYHDSLFMSRITPTGMIFIPCHKGYSHRPDEYSSMEDIVRGVQVLALTLAKLSHKS
ncbi:ureidoglycolate amidohydrolase [Marchantia polymorpha subsp. ruderalis]|uniref:Peptidase M20 dimerisation domain-containing protein n=2 Tax=Marchantia polymorpha TaxID=3197 RepID=A0AAF6BXL3_MARPO|nr:hypothetical protein MARPO_0068s0045 [Marchantia polymorpha]BBN16747.1 hypothetical protein Mp_7g08920 [Marchantia polymorpha subsp. ruderalis]|eukprot:PTQ35829.1 hypothetical protein MARPO_0068s0045 [Marchantia polymorpha]